MVNEKAQISSKQRREIRQEIYYCEKYGVSQSLFFKGADITPEKYINSLLGRISFALQIDPADVKMHEYFKAAKKLKSEVCGEKVGQNMEGMKLQITKARKQHNVLSPSFKLW